MTVLAHSLERTVTIGATRETVFRFFTDNTRWASWWGAGSTIEPHVGGQLLIRHPNGVEVTGEVLEIVAPERLVFTYGYVSGTPIPVGSSRVTIQLDSREAGTFLLLTHEFADASARDEHVQGWRYQLSLFSNLVSNELHIEADRVIDGWFDVWALTDAADCEAALMKIAVPTVQFHDRFSAVAGLTDLVPHLGAFHKFMPGMRVQRSGPVRHCQGVALAEWTATAADGQPRGSGTSVFLLGPDGKLTSVTGFWN